NDTLLWYARGVVALQARALNDPTSWRYLAAMHGFDPDLWQAFGYVGDSDAPPSAADQARDWQQCQHQSWYFLPWHRGYLAAFEAIVRAAVAAQGGPADWALPYWNYSDSADANALTFPPAFSAERLPDGTPNPLFVQRRYGDGSGKIVIRALDVQLNALLQSHFTGTTSGGSTGFGGPQTRFHHSSPDGSGNGQLERQPHNGMHSLIGGIIANSDPQDGRNYGLMSMPETAALDPIFWLHHANIDRLWQVWLDRDPNHHDESKAAWLTGPADRAFAMPRPDGSSQRFTAQDMLDTRAPALDYGYEDTSDPFGGATRLDARLTRLGVQPLAAAAAPEMHMAEPAPAELIGANDAEVPLQGGPVETRVRLDRPTLDKVSRSFAPEALAARREPDRVFLNLENIRGLNDATVFYVYVNLPDDADPAAHPDHLAGVVSLFGVRKASRVDDAHAGNGINEALEITEVIDRLHLNDALDLDHLRVRFVPRTTIRPQDRISIGRVRVYRQGR
ncbi:MAG TPA: tyrosinase family protein, partial [Dehalococcoidia bacterium]|nr:tyrosinase family protein [Dehalococcoidia bacterium]